MNTLFIYLKATCKLFILLSISLLFFSCNNSTQHREIIDLSGYWQF
ncbi:MAG TPA: hypothetical protein VJ909_07240 [Prolixibacteraceae bacterium]|nr:hypothetical protein [Prolixibacteraceae bacterium]